MTLAYLNHIMELKLPVQDGARELLQMAMIANQDRMVKRRDVSARKLAVLLNQSVVTTSRHLRKLVISGRVRVTHRKRVSYFQLPQIETTPQNDND